MFVTRLDLPEVLCIMQSNSHGEGTLCNAGLFILTGSTTVDESKIMHSGTGRISRMLMYPMSLFESGESKGGISLEELFQNPELNIDP